MTSSLRSRIRNGTLLLLALVIVLGAYALPRLSSLGGAIRETLYRNYISIEVGQHQHADAAKAATRGARRQGPRSAARGARRLHALDGHRAARHHRSGRAGARRTTSRRARRKLFDEIATAPPGAAPRQRIRSAPRAHRRSDRAQQGRDVPRRQPRDASSVLISLTRSPPDSRFCCWSAPRFRSGWDGRCRVR